MGIGSGQAKVTIVHETFAVDGAGATSVFCPPAFPHVVGGGFSSGQDEDEQFPNRERYHLRASYPVAAAIGPQPPGQQSGWRIEVQDASPDAVAHDAIAWAVCLSD